MSDNERERTTTIKAVFRHLETRAYDPKDPLPMKIADPVNPDRVIRFRASDDTLDRMGEVILAEGWDLGEFSVNPVIMQFHDYTSWPIGRAVAAGIVGNALMIDAEFDPPEVDESADLVFRKIKHGSVRTGSVGFQPMEWVTPGTAEAMKKEELFKKYPKATRIYTKSKLLEFTICPIPANPNALAASMDAAYAKRFGPVAVSVSAGDVASDNAEIIKRVAALRLMAINELRVD